MEVGQIKVGKNAIVYPSYPKSFKEYKRANGIGDLRGSLFKN